jgi:hypothetical protein
LQLFTETESHFPQGEAMHFTGAKRLNDCSTTASQLPHSRFSGLDGAQGTCYSISESSAVRARGLRPIKKQMYRAFKASFMLSRIDANLSKQHLGKLRCPSSRASPNKKTDVSSF